MKRRSLFIALAIILVSVVIYAWLGGFSSLVYEMEKYPSIEISGYEFTGRPTQQELEDIFYAMQEIAVDQDTALIVVTYPQPDTTAVVRQFIGVPGLKMDSLEVRSWPAGEYVSVRLTQNLLVTPSPEKVQQQASAFAAGLSKKLTGLSIEIYSRHKETQVIYPLKE